MSISYVVGDATKPCVNDGLRIIIHINNNLGGWGSSFIVALSKKWKEPEQKYRAWHKEQESCDGIMVLGDMQIVPVKDQYGTLYVANMVAQEGFASQDNPVALRYQSLYQCMKKVDRWAQAWIEVMGRIDRKKAFSEISIHMPRIGCGLAGGSWDKVSLLVDITLGHHDVFVYDLPGEAT